MKYSILFSTHQLICGENHSVNIFFHLIRSYVHSFKYYSYTSLFTFQNAIGKQRGQIIATGQIVKGLFSLLAGVIQTLLLNSPKTNPSNCKSCWNWGLDANGYYGLLFFIVIVLVFPVFWLKELNSKKIPVYTLKSHFYNIWDTLQSLTTLNMIIYSIGIGAFTHLPSIVSVYMQYYIIGLTSFQVSS